MKTMKTMTKMRRIQMRKRSVQKTNPNAALMKRAEAMAPRLQTEHLCGSARALALRKFFSTLLKTPNPVAS